jgi:hypothetical protein
MMALEQGKKRAMTARDQDVAWGAFRLAVPALESFGRQRLERRIACFGYARAAGYRPEARHVLFELKLAHVLCTTYQGGRKRERWSADKA